MFTTVYNVFLNFLSYLEPIWNVLATPVSELELFVDNGQLDWWEVLFPFLNFLPDFGEFLGNVFGESFSLLEFTLGSSILVLVSVYLYKFFKGFVN